MTDASAIAHDSGLPERALAARGLRALRSTDSLLLLAPLLLGVAYLVLLAANLGSTIDAIFSNGDIASAPYLGELYPQAAAGTNVVLGNMPWYTTLWFELLTRHVPLHHALWEVGPWLGSLAGIALLAWSTARVAAWWAGSLVAIVLVCAGSALLPIQFAWGTLHGSVAAHASLLGAFLVFLVSRAGRIGGAATHVLACGAVAAITAVGAASDKLLYPAGIAPFVLAGAVLALALPRQARLRVAATAVGVAAASALGSHLVIALMRDRHVYSVPFPISLATWNDVAPHFRDFLQSLAYLFGGDLDGEKPSFRSILAFAVAVAVVAALWVSVCVARSTIAELSRRFARGGEEPLPDAARLAHLTFWLLAIATSSATFVFSSVAGVHDGRYLIGAAYGIVTVVAVASARSSVWRRGVVVLGACLLVTASIVALSERDLERNPGIPTTAFASKLASIAESEGLKYGYASYWDAAPLTWYMRGRVQLYPAQECDADPHDGLCRVTYHRIDSWFTPREGDRTFLLVDRVFGPVDPDRTLGPPQQVIRLGRYTMSVYDHDIARDIGPPVPLN